MKRLVCADSGEDGGSGGAVEAGNNDAPQRLGGCANDGSFDSFDTLTSVRSHHDDNGVDKDDDDDGNDATTS